MVLDPLHESDWTLKDPENIFILHLRILKYEEHVAPKCRLTDHRMPERLTMQRQVMLRCSVISQQ